MRKQKFVIDTSALTGLSAKKPAIKRHILLLIELISKAKKKGIVCYTPPSVWKEMKGLLENKKIPAKEIKRLDAWLVQKSVCKDELKVPCEFLYEYISEVRQRFGKGLREAEKAVLSVGGNRPDPVVIGELRDKFKKAMRQGLVDSIEDLDVLMLAKELDAGIVAKDEGIKKWAKHWGIRFIDGESFPVLLKEYLKK
ncbi:MAG: RNA ligase partner protein [Candidatus Micrarchaeota archaeon]